MPLTDKEKGRPQQVFISYAANDQSVARRVADALRGAGLSVWFDEWVLLPGDSISQRIDEGLQASDLLLVLLSPSSVESRWVQEELNATLSLELRTRGVTVVPALIADCEMPPLLATRQYLDLRGDLEGGVQKLIEQLGVAPEIEFSRLDPRSFEKLVADLLVELGFSVELRRPARDSGFDFLATFTSNDPFGTERRESWLVEAIAI